MKIQKPEDEKYFKDITLNHILDEISKEDRNCIPDLLPYAEKKESKTKFYLYILFFVLLPMLLLVFFFRPLKTIDTQITKNATISTADTAKKKAIITVQEEILQSHKILKPKIENVRDKAKNDLLEQMKI